jgi:hypothetical protein
MSADIINLRRARKAKARAGREDAAASNRRLFGRTKSEKQQDAAERERAARTIEGHRRDKPEG